MEERNLSDVMVKQGVITQEQLATARTMLRQCGGDLSQALIKNGSTHEMELLKFFNGNLGYAIVNLKGSRIDRLLLRLVPYCLAQKYTAIPYQRTEEGVICAITDPANIAAFEAELHCEEMHLDYVLAPRQQIQKAIHENYVVHPMDQAKTGSVELVSADNQTSLARVEEVEELASSLGTVSVVNSILDSAYTEGASDIHVEPQESFVRVRLRINGVLEERQILSPKMLLPLISRIKIISSMNIAERRAPQDGRFTMKIRNEKVDCRVSTYPTVYGEKVVIRLLSKNSLIQLEQLGMAPTDCKAFRTCISRPHGLILVTGPTGSGKSTTLYAALQILNSIDKNIMSIEDPVENEIPGVNQAQLNTKANITFASAMRSMLRQDPDIIMVGEIRDAETAEMALRAALTGHLVLSTLHTNTAVGAVSRLINLGMPAFLVATSLIGVLGQRLVRKICSHCQTVATTPVAEAKLIGLESGSSVYFGKGCQACRYTGFGSRLGIFEFLSMHLPLRELIEQGCSEETLLARACDEGYTPMIQDAKNKILSGLTTVGEVVRVTEAIE